MSRDFSITVPAVSEGSAVKTNTAVRQAAERLRQIADDLDSITATLAAISATTVPFTPAGNIAATNVQAALAELDNEKVAKAGDTMTGSLTLSDGSIVFNPTWATNFALDTSGRTVSVANGALLTIFTNYSGLFVVNNWVNGAVALFIVGGGVVQGVLGASGQWTVIYAPAQNGYALYNNSGAAGVFSIAAIRTRNSA